MDKATKQTSKNTVMLYLLTFAKMIFPLVTLPYLTRILSTECYGVVAYVKACMTYMQIIVDFGFLLSGVKDIVESKGDNNKIGTIAGHIYGAKALLGISTLVLSVILSFALPLLRPYKLFVFLSTLAIFASAFLGDFLFRGIEKMHIITLSYVIMKGFSTALTFVFIHGEADILWIPILDIIGTVLAVVLTWIYTAKIRIPVRFNSIKYSFLLLKNSFVYFISQAATTAFAALNTLMVGIFIKDENSIAYWSVSLQLILAVQNLYNPIVNGIYPQMIREKNLTFIKKILLIFMPLITIGCVFCFFAAEWILVIVSGEEYRAAANVFRYLVPVLFVSFPAMILGWPTLGPIEKSKQVSASTIITAIMQAIGLVFLIAIGHFTIVNIAILRTITETFMLIIRGIFILRYRKLFETHEQSSMVQDITK